MSTGNNRIIKDISFSLLAEGKTIKIRADGYSMYPSIRPGAIISIEPLAAGTEPGPGEIIAWTREQGFVVHRLVAIEKEGEAKQYKTRGDSCLYEDPPVSRDRIAGRVIHVETAYGKTIASGDELIVHPSYLCNRSRVWLLLKIKKVFSISGITAK